MQLQGAVLEGTHPDDVNGAILGYHDLLLREI